MGQDVTGYIVLGEVKLKRDKCGFEPSNARPPSATTLNKVSSAILRAEMTTKYNHQGKSLILVRFSCAPLS